MQTTYSSRDRPRCRYATAEEVLAEFFDVRMRLYATRKAAQEKSTAARRDRLANRARFLDMVVRGEIELTRRNKRELADLLEAKGFTPVANFGDAAAPPPGDASYAGGGEEDAGATAAAAAAPADGDATALGAAAAGTAGAGAGASPERYSYLLSMQLWQLTREGVDTALAAGAGAEAELAALQVRAWRYAFPYVHPIGLMDIRIEGLAGGHVAGGPRGALGRAQPARVRAVSAPQRVVASGIAVRAFSRSHLVAVSLT